MGLIEYLSALSEGWQIFLAGVGLSSGSGFVYWLMGWFKKKNQAELLKPPTAQGDLYQGVGSQTLSSYPGSDLLEPPDIEFPTTGKIFLGRDKELAELNSALASGNTNIFALVAMGGAGKTSLLRRWLSSVGAGKWSGFKRVYGRSFYRTGALENSQGSADAFFEEALKAFGYEGGKISSSWDKGLTLAKLVQKQKTLLLIDGLEPMQHLTGDMRGALKDQSLIALFKRLAEFNPGICIVTSRVPLVDLDDMAAPSVISKDVEQLTETDGIALLKALGVIGREEELAAAVAEYEGHALALILFSNLLKRRYGGDIRKKDKIPALTGEKKLGSHAWRVMASYEKQLKGTPHLSLIYLVSLFDRPADRQAFKILLKEPTGTMLKKAIGRFGGYERLVRKLRKLSPEDFNDALGILRDLGLLSRNEDENDKTLDAHPLVREYFSARLKQINKPAFIEAHSRLYEYYKDIAEPLPETLLEMEPLFAAIAHGCAAGQHQEVFDEVYYRRVQRGGNISFLCKQLGGIGADLAALSSFFAAPWQTAEAGLTAPAKAFALNAAGFGLRALGRLREATEPLQAGLDMSRSQGDWKNTAASAGNLSQLYLTLGDVKQAINHAQDSVTFADKSPDEFLKMLNRTIHADVLHLAGQLDETLVLFKQAETMQRALEKEYHFLYSVHGYQYCDLLLSMGQHDEVKKRAEETLKWAKVNKFQLLTIALDTLSLGRAELACILEANSKDFTSAADYIEKAVNGLRKAGTLHYIPRGLLARAECYRHQKQYDDAEDDLTEVFDISERSGMLLFLTDAHLEAARLARAAGKMICGHGADYHIEQAAALIAKTRYKRREPELEALQAG